MNVALTVIFVLEIATVITRTEAFPNWWQGGKDKYKHRSHHHHHHRVVTCEVGHCVKAWECPKSALAAESEKDSCVYRESGPWVCCLIHDDSYHRWEGAPTYASVAPNNFRLTTTKPHTTSAASSIEKHWHGARKPLLNDFGNRNGEEESPSIRPLSDILKNDREKYPFYRPVNKTLSSKIPSASVSNDVVGRDNKSTASTLNKRTTNVWDKPRTSTKSPTYYKRTTHTWGKPRISTLSTGYYKKTTNLWEKRHTPDSRIIFPTEGDEKYTTFSPLTKRIANNVPTKRAWTLSTSTKAAWGYTTSYARRTISTTTKYPYFKKSTISTKESTRVKDQSWGSFTTVYSARAQTAKPKTTKPTPTAKSTRRYSVTTPLPNVNTHLCGIGNERTNLNRQARNGNYRHNQNGYAVHSGNSSSRGKLPYERIVGGEEAEPFSWPWVVALYKVTSSGGNRFLSAGSLINEDFILTAAHVFTPDDLRTASYVAMLGTHDAQDAVAQYIVSFVLLHPNYEHRYYYNDIALLKLERKVEFNNYIMPVCLPSPNAPLHSDKDLIGKNVTVMGWGDDSFGGKSSQVLKEASFPIVSRVSCNASYVRVASNRFPTGITADMLCAGDPRGGKDACQGDSGGPLTVIENGRYTQVGIVSFGYKCGDKEFPGVYTKVAPYLGWIAENTRHVDDSRNYEHY